ncbi:MAG TPA: tRNA (guanosine(37)-N1)-methyltransferase TrmD [Bacteroidetes bacterium]|nr:MAG: tRNA (guanosine(37)-N1)-methyltransferase TrmD [Rhodothermaceae bacterium TMED105]HBV99754.1 tRNA (guanosine(37)-N1)-methyltransferase TrmD [Bacteroidota bacterium]|tara:strand:- start:390 stop:1088 length:699 start_codon:yes stop_codon:yes gene_type:complete
MRIDLLSAVPSLLQSPLTHSIVGRAQERSLVDIQTHDLHEYSTDKHKKVDDIPYGGGAGMVLTPQPIFDAVEHIQKESGQTKPLVIYTSPQGAPFDQEEATKLSLESHLILLCGHYKGVDQRVRDHLITKEYSFGDVVYSGGELPALCIVDAVVRLLPNALNDVDSAMTDSFQDGLLEGPVYTRPSSFRGHEVPDVLRSGDHERIRQWKQEQAEELTKRVRPDLFEKYQSKP